MNLTHTMKCLIILCLVQLHISIKAVYAQKITHSERNEVRTPEEERAGFKVPEGFIVELVASERDGVVNPIDITFDDAGRLWTQTASMYPLDPVADIQWHDLLQLMNDPEAQQNHPNFKRVLDLYKGKTKGDDKILLLSNIYDTDKLDVKVWADGLTIPQSILPYKNGAYVAQGSELFYLEDTDDDGTADKRNELFTGFGITDTHTMAHSLLRGPGGWIHFSHGALNKGKVTSLVSGKEHNIDYSKIAKFSLDGAQLEVITAGLQNIWGFQQLANGQWYGTEANDLGYSVVPMEEGTAFPGIGNEKIRPYQPWVPELHKFRVGGTGISGLAFAEDQSNTYPEEWKNVAFLANPITSTINTVKIKREKDGSVSAKHLPDFLTSEDDWFRPVNLEIGPDGCLYVVDWYNKIVSHNELPTTHPDRDKSHGRIWRIRHESQTPQEIPNFYEIKTSKLPDYLKSPSLWAKRAAWHQIADRPAKSTKKLIPALKKLIADPSEDEVSRIHALWALESLKHYDKKLMLSLLQSSPDNLRREAIRSLASFSLQPSEVAEMLAPLVEDSNAMIRSQLLRTLADIKAADAKTIELLVRASKPASATNEMGGGYERNFERYLARKALEQYPKELQAFIDSQGVENVAMENILWAIMALPKNQKEAAFLKYWPETKMKQMDEPTFVSVALMLENKDIYRVIKPAFNSSTVAKRYLQYAIRNQSSIQSDELGNLLQPAARHLLKSDKIENLHIALDAFARYNMDELHSEIVALIDGRSSEHTINLVLRALESKPSANQQLFTTIFQNQELSLNTRIAALHSLIKADTKSGGVQAQEWLTSLDDEQKSVLVTQLSASKAGCQILKSMYVNEMLKPANFSLSAAEKVYQANNVDANGVRILDEVKAHISAEKKKFQAKLDRFMGIAEAGGGDPQKGEMLFQTCLMCHKVGSKGQTIAPALDGSASRENEALITAIIDPDAAVESSYQLYRLTKNDGSSIEGYLVKKDERGTTIAFMGGSERFIDAKEIKSEGFVSGRSFMMKGLIDYYTDEQVANLLSYIKTLK